MLQLINKLFIFIACIIMIINCKQTRTQQNGSESLRLFLRDKAQTIRDNNFKVNQYNNQTFSKKALSPQFTTLSNSNFIGMLTNLKKDIKNKIKNGKEKNNYFQKTNSSMVLGHPVNLTSFASRQQILSKNNKIKTNTTQSQASVFLPQKLLLASKRRKMSSAHYYQKIHRGSNIARPKTIEDKRITLKMKTEEQIQGEPEEQFIPLGPVHFNRYENFENIQVSELNQQIVTSSEHRGSEEDNLKQIYGRVFVNYPVIPIHNIVRKPNKNIRNLYKTCRLDWEKQRKKSSGKKIIIMSEHQIKKSPEKKKRGKNMDELSPWGQQKY